MNRTGLLSPKITPDEFLRLPDEGMGFEHVDGELRESEVSKPSSRIAHQIATRLENFSVSHFPGWVFGDGCFYRCFPDDASRVRRADTSFIAFERMTPEEYYEDGFTEIAPDLVVEVTSPSNTVYDVDRKIGEWLAAGVRLVWEVNPEARTVQIYRIDGSVALFRKAPTPSPPNPSCQGFPFP